MSSELRNRKNKGDKQKEDIKASAIPSQGVTLETKPFLQEDFIDAFYKPHTVSILLLLLATLAYFVFLRDDQDFSLTHNVKRGLTAIILIFIVYCTVQLRDGRMLRPHPALWRAVTGVGIVYWLALVFTLFQTRDQARSLFTYLYPELGVPLPERSYADDCRLYTPENPEGSFKNLRDTVFDEFIIAHALGHAGKAILMRDWKLCWIMSLTFEIAEISFQHWMENFKECWWDHIILDVLVCNAAGIWVGLKICDFFKMKKYNRWVGVSKIETTSGKISRIVGQFTPFEWTSYDWDIWNSAKQLGYLLGIVFAFNIVELNAFFLKYILWIPPKNPLNTYRLILWFFIGIPALREYYEYATDKTCKRLGANAWLAAAIVITEALIIFKFSSGLFTAPPPPHVWFNWVLFLFFFITWFILFYYVFSKETRDRSFIIRNFLNLLLSFSLIPLFVMFFMGCPDLEWGKEWFDNTINHVVKRYL